MAASSECRGTETDCVVQPHALRYLVCGILLATGVWATYEGASVLFSPNSLLTEEHGRGFVYSWGGVDFDVFRSPDTTLIAKHGTFLATGLLLVGMAGLVVVRHFSLRLLLVLVLMATAAGAMPQVLVPTTDIELVTIADFDVQMDDLLSRRSCLNPDTVFSACPEKIRDQFQFGAADAEVVQWSVEQGSPDRGTRLVLRLARPLGLEQLNLLCSAYADRLGQMTLASATAETRQAISSRYWWGDYWGPRCSCGYPLEAERKAQRDSLDELRKWEDLLAAIEDTRPASGDYEPGVQYFGFHAAESNTATEDLPDPTQ